jgi:hypothetical protein
MSSAIRDAGLTLIELLRDNLVANPTTADRPIASRTQIALLSPRDVNQDSNIRLTLFLYSIAPAVALRNDLEIPGSRNFNGELSEPLDLYYLLTAFGAVTQDDPSDPTLDAQLLLGFAMRVFFDNGILAGSTLKGDLPSDEELRLTLQPMTVEDLTRIWSVFPDSVLRASVSFLLTPIRLRSTRVQGGALVTSRRADVDQVVAIKDREEAA